MMHQRPPFLVVQHFISGTPHRWKHYEGGPSLGEIRAAADAIRTAPDARSVCSIGEHRVVAMRDGGTLRATMFDANDNPVAELVAIDERGDPIAVEIATGRAWLAERPQTDSPTFCVTKLLAGQTWIADEPDENATREAIENWQRQDALRVTVEAIAWAWFTRPDEGSSFGPCPK